MRPRCASRRHRGPNKFHRDRMNARANPSGVVAHEDDDNGLDDIDMTTWHALQTWLKGGEHDVVIPYGKALADLVPPVAVRLRRDIRAVRNLIHRANRIPIYPPQFLDEWARSILSPPMRSTSDAVESACTTKAQDDADFKEVPCAPRAPS